jgi:hypothetical protein
MPYEMPFSSLLPMICCMNFAQVAVSLVPTTTQNGGEKSIEYSQLKAATLAGECQKVFVATVFAFQVDKAVVDVSRDTCK